MVVENALTECEAAWLHTLVGCMHETLPNKLPFYQERPFGTDQTATTYGLYNINGGNHVTFIAGLIQYYLPGVVHSLYQAVTAAYDLAQWGKPETFVQELNMYSVEEVDQNSALGALPHPNSLGIRTAEYLEYHTTGRLGLHADTESMYTISIALSDPSDYEGGYFQMKHDEVLFKVPRLSAVVFYSEASHGDRKSVV